MFNKLKYNGYYTRKFEDNKIGITLNESFSNSDCVFLINSIINNSKNKSIKNITLDFFEEQMNIINQNIDFYNDEIFRENNFLNQSIFKESKSETFMSRYINSLADKDYSLVSGMIPLGSCTMKLNSSSQMTPLSYDNICKHHPFMNLTPGIYNYIIKELSDYLLNITNMHSISYSPNSGAMGEYAGLLCIKKYHESNNNNHRNICLIPNSAHGTNFASANMCNMKIVKFDDDISLEDFETLVKKNNENLSCMMITYPNTYGILRRKMDLK